MTVEGLSRVQAIPVRSVYVEATATTASDVPFRARLEAGAKPWSNFGVYAGAETDARLNWNAGVGARWTWGW